MIAFIPARGGSKRIPRKNLCTVEGQTLVERSVRCAVEAGLRPIVSTDDDEIAREALRCGAEVHEREPRHAGDKAQIEQALRHWVGRQPLTPETVLAILQPTSPLRSPETVRRCVEPVASGHWRAACTVSEAPGFYGEIVDEGRGGRFRRDDPIEHRPGMGEPSMRARVRENGCVYVFTARHLADVGYRLSEGDTAAIVIDKQEALDVDYMADLEEARDIAQRRRRDVS